MDGLRALRYLHDKGLTHSDVKPANFMCNKDLNEMSIVDYGMTGSECLVISASKKVQLNMCDGCFHSGGASFKHRFVSDGACEKGYSRQGVNNLGILLSNT